MLLKTLLAILALTCSISVNSKVYSSRLWDERSQFCKNVEATTVVVVEVGLSKTLAKNILSHPEVKKLSTTDQITLFDAVYLADKRKSTFWVFDFCMDRLET